MKKKSTLGSINDHIVLRNCSVRLRISLVSPSVLLFSELDEVLDKVKKGVSMSDQQQRVSDTTNTCGEDTDVDQPRRGVRSRRYFKLKKAYTVGQLAQFFVTGPTDAASKLSEFYCKVSQKDVSVLTNGAYEINKRFQGHRHSARDQRLRLETPGWRVLDFYCNPLPVGELERQREKIMFAPLAAWDRKYSFREDLIPDAFGNVDPQLPMLAKVSYLIHALQLGGSYEPVQKLWEGFLLTASCINVPVAWSHDEVLVSSVLSPNSKCKNLSYFGKKIVFLF